MFTPKWWSIEHTHTPVPQAANTPIPKHTASYKSTKNLSVAKCKFYDPSFPSNALSHYSIKLPAFVTNITSYGYVVVQTMFWKFSEDRLMYLFDLLIVPFYNLGSLPHFQPSFQKWFWFWIPNELQTTFHSINPRFFALSTFLYLQLPGEKMPKIKQSNLHKTGKMAPSPWKTNTQSEKEKWGGNLSEH